MVNENETLTPADVAPVTVKAEPDAIHCQYCGESSETLSGPSLLEFWSQHDTPGHKLETLAAKVGMVPTDDIVREVIDILRNVHAPRRG